MNIHDLILFNTINNNSTLVEHTVTGNASVFTTECAKPLTGLTADISFIQSGTGDPSLSNICPITGFNSLNAYHHGKNIGHIYGYSAGNVNHTAASLVSNSYGTTISTTSADAESVVVTQSSTVSGYTISSYRNGYFSVRIDNLLEDFHYAVSFKITNITNNPLDASLEDMLIMGRNYQSSLPTVNGNVVTFENYVYHQDGKKDCIEIRNCGMSFTISEFMVTVVGVSDRTYKPYINNVYSVIFPADVTSGFIYGGSFDFTTGLLTITHFGATKKISDYSMKSDNGEMTNYVFNNLTNLPIINNETQVCSIGKYSWNDYESTFDHFYMYTSNNADQTRLLLYLNGTSIDETQEFTFVAPLAESYTVQLDPTVINTLIGENYIFVDNQSSLTTKYLDKS